MSIQTEAGIDYLAAASAADPEVCELIRQEEQRQADCLRLIPSENYASRAVMEATGSVLTNKYSEGYPRKRYYEGQQFIDQIEEIAVSRAKALFGVDHANVQPYSGSPANQAIYLAMLEPGGKVMGLHLAHGGHLTHGWKVSVTGKHYDAVQFIVDEKTHMLDYDAIRDLAVKERPQLIIAGTTAYPRVLDFEKFAAIAKEVDAVFAADIAHISGLIVAGAHPSPVPHADIVSTTTHKTLRGPRGGMLMCKEAFAKPVDRAVFPGLQGGPHNHTTAAIAIALKEASTPEFKDYGQQIVKNAKILAEGLMEHGFALITGGTDNHLILIDMTNKGVTGKVTSQALDKAGIVCNYNAVPFDPRKPFDPSGIRIGTPSMTSRGMKEPEMKMLADWMSEVVDNHEDESILVRLKAEVKELCDRFPAPGLTV